MKTILPLVLFALLLVSAAPAMAASPTQVQVSVVVQPCQGAPSSLYLNSTNYIPVQYIQGGQTQTTDVWQNTTIQVDAGSIVVPAQYSALSKSTPVGELIWTVFAGPTLINSSTTLNIPYCPTLSNPTAAILFGGSPYQPSLGVLREAQTVLGGVAGAFAYDSTTGILTESGIVYIGTGPGGVERLTVPTEWWTSGGVWQIKGNNSFGIMDVITSGQTPSFNYAFVAGAKPALPAWSFSAPTPLYVGDSITGSLVLPYPLNVIQSASVNGQNCFTSCSITAGAPGNLTLDADASIFVGVLAPSPGGVGAIVSSQVLNITSVDVLKVVPPSEAVTFAETGLPSGFGYVTVAAANESLPYSTTATYGSQVSFSFPATLRSGNTTYVLITPTASPLTVTSNITETAQYIAVQPVVVTHTVYVPTFSTSYVPYIPFWLFLALIVATDVAAVYIYSYYSKVRKERQKRKQEAEKAHRELEVARSELP